MSKHLLEDMVKIKRPKEDNRIKVNKKENLEIKKQPKENSIKKIWEEGRNNREINYAKSKSRYMLWFVAVISVIFCLFALSFLFGKAEVIVNPKMKDIVLNENLSTSKDSNNNGLFFNLVVIPGEENKTIQATGEKDVAIKATGIVVIFNSFSSASQSFNVDTRLEGSNGKIYKTQEKIVVPGKSKDGTSGQAEVKIYASVAGSEYNSSPLDFKVLGFKGTPKYSKFIGRSKTGTEITGGFVGKVPDVSDFDKANAINDLKTILQTKLLQKATDQIPNGFILFKDAIFLNTDDANNEPNITSVNNNDNSLTLTLHGTLYGFLFNEQKLTQKIAKDSINKYDGNDVYVPKIRDLTFTLANKDAISFADVQNISFNLSGSSKIIWKLDTDKFTADLLGKSKKDFNQILSQYPNIDSATLKLSFPWMQSIPSKLKDIKVIVNYPK